MLWEQGVGWLAMLAIVILIASGLGTAGGGGGDDTPLMALFAAVALSL